MRNIVFYLRYIIDCFITYRDIKKARALDVDLEPGWYFISRNSRCFLFHNNTPLSFLKMIGVDENKPKLYCYYQRKRKRCGFYDTQVIMTTNDGVRYFNYKEKTTLHCFNNYFEKELYQKARSFLVPPFKCTTIQVKDSYCIERLIEHIPRRAWSYEEVLKRFFIIFDKYIEYLSKTHIFEHNIQDMLQAPKEINERYNQIMESLIHSIEVYKNTKFIFSHGDMHFENVLFENNDFYVLDFETAGNNIFYYDIFNLMYVEYIDKHNDYFIKAYLSKETMMMTYFERMFNVVNESFDYSLMHIYLKYFLLVRLSRSVSFLESKSDKIDYQNLVNNNVEKIKRVIDTISQYET